MLKIVQSGGMKVSVAGFIIFHHLRGEESRLFITISDGCVHLEARVDSVAYEPSIKPCLDGYRPAFGVLVVMLDESSETGIITFR